jgi:hypothetical protein
LDIINDPQATHRSEIESVWAKVQYYNGTGELARTIDKALWINGWCNSDFVLGESRKLVIGILDEQLLAIDHKFEGYEEGFPHFVPFRVELIGTFYKVVVTVTYAYPTLYIDGHKDRNTQEFNLELTLKEKRLGLRHLPDPTS